MTVISFENKNTQKMALPGLGIMLDASSTTELDWDQGVLEGLSYGQTELQVLFDTGVLKILLNGIYVPKFSCLLTTDRGSVFNKTTKEYIEGTDVIPYMDGNWILVPDPVVGIESRYWFINNDDSVRAMTSTEIDVQESPNMMEHKEVRVSEVYQRTTDLNELGFDYKGVHFNLDKDAQGNWSALLTAGLADMLIYPLSVSQSDGTVYMVTGLTELKQLTGTALGAVSNNYSSGRSLISQIWSASTKSVLDAIKDNR